ncbi:hypothetical protein HCUR_00111 [Holospora curviuscula]|uniref:Uncharacterized protein n=1 Tax=Holospora curviuscula TaxID=1082868 RepID=A0A2S5RHZ7_9PROT|nr:hypothetical protein HCUR_00111 [Holospora curviuscula]
MHQAAQTLGRSKNGFITKIYTFVEELRKFPLNLFSIQIRGIKLMTEIFLFYRVGQKQTKLSFHPVPMVRIQEILLNVFLEPLSILGSVFFF